MVTERRETRKGEGGQVRESWERRTARLDESREKQAQLMAQRTFSPLERLMDCLISENQMVL